LAPVISACRLLFKFEFLGSKNALARQAFMRNEREAKAPPAIQERRGTCFSHQAL
jgi:hypothetical protein